MRGHQVSIIGQSANVVAESAQFCAWMENFNFVKMEVKAVFIQSAHFFGNGRVAFITAEAEAYDRETGKRLPGITFVRGPAVCVLLVITCIETGERFVVLTKQPRVPLGKYEFLELPAGMMDKNDGFRVRVIAELREETGVDFPIENLQELGKWAPSAGGCDEFLVSFYGEMDMHQENIEQIKEAVHGVAQENEKIRLELMSMKKFVQSCGNGTIQDGKALATLALLLVRKHADLTVEILSKCN